MQGKLFQRCTHFLYCSVLCLGGKVNTRQMSQLDMKSIFTKKSMKYSGHRKLLCEFSKLNALTSSDTTRTLMHLFLFPKSAQRELVSICTWSIRDFLALVPWGIAIFVWWVTYNYNYNSFKNNPLCSFQKD